MTSRFLRMLTVVALVTLVGCATTPAPTVALPTVTAISPTATAIPPTATPLPPPTQTPAPPAGTLSVISPLETTSLYGGQALRIAVYLVDNDDQPVEKATVQAELWSPGGELFTTVPCADKGLGRYMAEYVELPMRGAGGAWRMVAHATWGDDAQVQAEQVFTGIVSPSEMYQNQVGFWIDPPRSLNYNFDMFNLDGAGGFHFEDWHYENGGGYVVFDNYRYTTIGVTFSDLDIHWRHGDLPADEAAVMTHVQNLAGPNHQEPDTPITDMVVKSTTFQGRGAWHVAGQWREAYVAQSGSLRPAEWLIFRCPGSEWLWTLVISADKAEYMTYLRTLQETFECPVVE